MRTPSTNLTTYPDVHKSFSRVSYNPKKIKKMVQVVVVDGDIDRRSTLTTENMMDNAVFAGRESLMEDATRLSEEDETSMIKIDDAATAESSDGASSFREDSMVLESRRSQVRQQPPVVVVVPPRPPAEIRTERQARPPSCLFAKCFG